MLNFRANKMKMINKIIIKMIVSLCATAFSVLNFRAICEIVSHISTAKNSTDLQPNYNYRTKPPNIVKYVDPFDL